MSRAKRRPLAEALRAPHHGDGRALQQRRVAEHRQQRRRVVDCGERCGIIGLAPSHQLRPGAAERRQLALGGGGRAGHHRALPSSPPRQLRQRRQGRRGGTEALPELIKGDGADILAADQAEPVEFFGGQTWAATMR
jgi:hypothetical protein